MTGRISFLSAARSDYDLFAPVLTALAVWPQVRPDVIACSAQLSPFHGMGVRQIEEDNVTVSCRIESILGSESLAGRAHSTARLLHGLTDHLVVSRPDLLFVTGDREEHLTGALAGNFLGIPVAHLHGGDRCIAADIDEVFRPAISKLAHFHFTAAASHRERLIRMGEAPDRIWATGAPSLDRLRATPEPASDEELNAVVGFDTRQPFFLLIQHPSPTFSRGRDGEEMKELLEGALAGGMPVLCSYPNSDPGNVAIRHAIDAAASQTPLLKTYHNLPRAIFVNIYRRCAGVIGNSSSLVVESAFLKKPAVLVGPRQDLRDRATNVLRVDFDSKAVAEACRRCLDDAEFLAQVQRTASLYGDGHSAARVAEILAGLDLDPGVLCKIMSY